MEMMEAYNQKLELQMQMLAWHAANVMNVHLKRQVTPDKLLGKSKSKQMSPIDREQEVAKLRNALSERRNPNGSREYNRNTSN
jgi:hypothetical protein